MEIQNKYLRFDVPNSLSRLSSDSSFKSLGNHEIAPKNFVFGSKAFLVKHFLDNFYQWDSFNKLIFNEDLK